MECVQSWACVAYFLRQAWSTGTSHMIKETFLSMTSVSPVEAGPSHWRHVVRIANAITRRSLLATPIWWRPL